MELRTAVEVEMGPSIVELSDARSCVHELVGGKGANLGQLAQAGFPVPPAFTVTTHAYTQFMEESGLKEEIAGLLEEIVYDDIELLERQTAEIRRRLATTEVPQQLASDIDDAYSALSDDLYVAVRSSGTAEDLAGTSFAGLHDTYLDVRGSAGVVDAVKDCWGSLWSARATGYRQRNGFDHFDVRLAVVVQAMVISEVSGVMFTGNPRTAATDETVINASWGLGEAVVQGIVTPDEFTVKSGTLLIDGTPTPGSRHVLERSLGSKERQYVRNPDTGIGTIIQDIPAPRRAEFSMTDPQVVKLAALGQRVTDHYDGYPQDIEWALADGELYLLQSRPITGVEFSWDADVDIWQEIPNDPFVIRTRGMADEAWTGAITPLMYSWRAQAWNVPFWAAIEIFGRDDLRQKRLWQYHKGYAFWNCEFEQGLFCETALAIARPGALKRLPPDWHEQAMNAKFALPDYLKWLARIRVLRPDIGPYGWFKVLQNYIENRIPEAEGLPDEEMRALPDRELKDYIRRQIAFEETYNVDCCATGFFFFARDSMAALGTIIAQWYTGTNEQAFAHLVTGTPTPTATIREHVELASLARDIRGSEQVLADFKAHRDSAFFDALNDSEDGRAFAARISAFLASSGHRGHPDRDIYFPRYADDPAVVYGALEAHLKSEDDPAEQEHRNTQLRNAAYQDVLENLRGGPLGFVKAEAFKLVHDYVIRFLEFRDNERQFIDRNTYSIRKAFLEIGQRVKDRGLVETDRDFWFLTVPELYELLDGHANRTLVRHKIEGRMRNFDRWDRKEVTMPKFLQRNHPVDFGGQTSSTDEQGRTILRGTGTSGGQITATARVVKSLKEISRVNKGEIMIANSTDPGWTPIFAAISGVIVETGGLLSHSGCLAREYGFPAAQIDNTLTAIPDGATITLDGDAGWVRIEKIADASVLEPEAATA